MLASGGVGRSQNSSSVFETAVVPPQQMPNVGVSKSPSTSIRQFPLLCNTSWGGNVLETFPPFKGERVVEITIVALCSRVLKQRHAGHIDHDLDSLDISSKIIDR